MPSSAKVAYAKISSQDQNLGRQLEAFKTLNVDRIFTDKASGKDKDRPGSKDMFSYVREGYHLYVVSMDRLARNLKDLLEVCECLQKKGVSVHLLKENIVIAANEEQPLISKLFLSIMGVVAEFERTLIRERQAEGITLTKKRGAYKGRVPVSTEVIAKAKERIALGVPITKVAKELDISSQQSTSTFERLIIEKIAGDISFAE